MDRAALYCDTCQEHHFRGTPEPCPNCEAADDAVPPPPLATADPAALQALGISTSTAEVWLQRRADGTVWVFYPDGRVLDVRPDDLHPTWEFDCANGHTYLGVGDDPPCPTCNFPNDGVEAPLPSKVIPDLGRYMEQRLRVRRRVALSLGFLITALLAVGGDVAFREWSLQELLAATTAVEDPVLWAPYWELRACGPEPTEQNSESIHTIAQTWADSAEGLRNDLQDRVRLLREVRIAPWHTELEVARQRIQAHEQVWIDHLGNEVTALTTLTDMPAGEAREAFEAWVEWELEVGSSITGTFLAAEHATRAADGATVVDHAAEIAAIFAPDAPRVSCEPGDT